MNPYAAHLGSSDPLDVIAGTASRLEALVETIGARRVVEAPAPGKWSTREILCHLADTELTFAFRLRQTLAEDRHVIQPFDQDKWAAQYRAYHAADALAVFTSLRRWNLALMRGLPPEAWSRSVTHPERGTMTFRTIVETMAGHDTNHVHQIEAIAAKSAEA
jgi:hypothetical protein